MKYVHTIAVIACLGLNACGAKNDLNAEDAADALQALLETKGTYDGRTEDAASVACAEGGKVVGLTKSNERTRASRGVDYTLTLQSCQNRGIVMDGSANNQHEHAAVQRDSDGPTDPTIAMVRRYDGSLLLHGSVQGSCDFHLIARGLNGAQGEAQRDKSTFCGHDVDTLITILSTRNDAAREQAAQEAALVPPAGEDAEIIAQTADVEEVSDEAAPPPAAP